MFNNVITFKGRRFVMTERTELRKKHPLDSVVLSTLTHFFGKFNKYTSCEFDKNLNIT